jgi:hypothetical protein
LVGLNNSRKTSVNVFRKPGPVPDINTQTGYGPEDIDPDANGGQHVGIFILSDFHTPVEKLVAARSLGEAIALFNVTYGAQNILDTPEIVEF